MGVISKTGFYRTTTYKKDDKEYFKYTIKNKLIFKEITRKNIMELKKEVEKQGFLWGITDMKKAKENNSDYKLKVVQGKYGKKVGE